MCRKEQRVTWQNSSRYDRINEQSLALKLAELCLIHTTNKFSKHNVKSHHIRGGGGTENAHKYYLMFTHKSCLTGYGKGVRGTQRSGKDLNTGQHQLIKVNPDLAEILLSEICFPSEPIATKYLSSTCVSISAMPSSNSSS